ncbi:MAG: bifunctional pyr operon transcriptional regulator/uracil phosphoribosyltransferase PyrR [Oscillospiraceae bacterium]|nr:bifunctional pyr operon transcriptional regulator/uracil phosphoribosyltransferase PyrR [Oscillospiraceae bacterium]
MMEKALILDDKAMSRAINRISYEIIERSKGVEDLCVVGILSRGKELADRIAGKILQVEGKSVPVGYLDITPFRDDGREGSGETCIPFDIGGKKVVLVDDVIYTGRSVRAAIDALMAVGRPESIQLAVLIDRGHRELPIRADFIGKNVPTSREESVRVSVRERDGEDKVVIVGS